MRALVLGIGVVAGWLSATPSGRAGVYNPDEPPSLASPLESPGKLLGRLPAYEPVWKRLSELRNVDDRVAKAAKGKGEPVRRDYEQQALDLEKLRRDGALSIRQYVSLGGGLMRLGRPEQARTVLEEGLRQAQPGDPARFLLLLNLAAANMDPEELLPRAVDYQRQALAAWPAVWAGWDREQWYWYRRVETFTLTLLQERQRELIQSGGRAGAFTAVDTLFPRVRFVGPTGAYEAGAIAFRYWNELPPDAELVALQMLLSRPNDPRLLWLYGELLNARGQIRSAFLVLDYIVDPLSYSFIPELKKHRSTLAYTLELIKELEKPAVKEALLWWLAPRGMPVPAGVGASLAELAWPGAALARTQQEIPIGGFPPPVPAPVSRLPDWRALLVGFAMGIFAAMLGLFQWAELRRRRRAGQLTLENGRPPAAPARDGPAPTSVTRQPEG
jgi:hypothetical protein